MKDYLKFYNYFLIRWNFESIGIRIGNEIVEYENSLIELENNKNNSQLGDKESISLDNEFDLEKGINLIK